MKGQAITSLLLVLLSTLEVINAATITHNMTASTTASERNEVNLSDSFEMTCSYSNLINTLSKPSILWSKKSACNSEKLLTIFTSAGDGSKVFDGFDVSPKVLTESNPPRTGSIQMTETSISNSLDPNCYTFIYECQIRTADGIQINYDRHIHTASISITLVDPAQIVHVSDNELNKREGDSLSLLCRTTGIPKPSVIWTRSDGKPFSPLIGGGLHYDASDNVDGELQISHLSKKDAGEYQCSAKNRLITQPVSQTVTVDVQYAPQIEIPSLIVYQKENYDTELICEGTAKPQIVRTDWYYVTTRSSLGDADSTKEDGSYKLVIADDDKRLMKRPENITTSGPVKTVLYLQRVVKEDFTRKYCCEFTNEQGQSSSCIEINESSTPVLVGGKPPKKYSVRSHSSSVLPTMLLVLPSMLIALTVGTAYL